MEKHKIGKEELFNIRLHLRLTQLEFLKDTLGIKDLRYFIKKYFNPREATDADKYISKNLSLCLRRYKILKKKEPDFHNDAVKRVKKHFEKLKMVA